VSHGLEEFNLEKKGIFLTDFPNENLPKLHQGILSIKNSKYLDVQSLAAEYVLLNSFSFIIL